MSFWTSEQGELTGSADDAFAKSFKQVPDGTMALASIHKYCLEEHDGFKYFKIDWLLTEGDFKGQHVYQKIKAIDADSRDKNPTRTKHRALNMMMMLYKLFKLRPASDAMPTDQDLLVFNGKIAGIKIQETEPNQATGKQYNWVSEVHAAQGFKCETGVSAQVTHTRPSLESSFSRQREAGEDSLHDDVPW